MLNIASFRIISGDPFDQSDCGQTLFFKTILSNFESFMKVVVPVCADEFGFLIA
jgi:hypothetical protein